MSKQIKITLWPNATNQEIIKEAIDTVLRELGWSAVGELEFYDVFHGEKLSRDGKEVCRRLDTSSFNLTAMVFFHRQVGEAEWSDCTFIIIRDTYGGHERTLTLEATLKWVGNTPTLTTEIPVYAQWLPK